MEVLTWENLTDDEKELVLAEFHDDELELYHDNPYVNAIIESKIPFCLFSFDEKLEHLCIQADAGGGNFSSKDLADRIQAECLPIVLPKNVKFRRV